MSSKAVIVITAAISLVVGTAMVAAPGQDRQGLPAPGTERPGQLTRGQVFIENRDRSEAIPITALDPLPVLVQNAAGSPVPVRLAGSSPDAPAVVTTRRVAENWEYQTVTVPPDAAPQDLTGILAGPGANGWEPAGIQIAVRGGTLVVLRRPRP